ncbi:hypothetical protein KIM372_01120 [Bombiscardovia nodaiensis]|uniref:Uncharacterized protein n=1 Tax=Bombiscardovia nodaiensis TaxID=2932181 RepID=A0ABN6SBL1_9BIFI|nr:hypothetical protein KIM372_01120 [Bombiscardovia nodaiensis]
MTQLQRVRVPPEAQAQYNYYKRTDLHLAQVMAQTLQRLDKGPLKEAGQKKTSKGMAHWIRIDLPGAQRKQYGIVWKEESDGTAVVSYIGYMP